VTTPEPRPANAPGTDPTLSVPVGPSGDAAGAPGPATTSGPSTAGPATTGPATPRPGTAPQSQPGRSTGRTIGRTLALALLVFVTVVLVLFVMFNTQTVDISLVFTDVEAPLVVALLVAAVLGGLVASLASLVRRARRR
jgi:uncharacterized integral membrane protein